jgi:hypothetical protein
MAIIGTVTIYNRDGSIAQLPAEQARYRTYMRPDEWSLTPPPPPGWELTIPMYKVTRDLRPASRPRYRFEPPFTSISDNDCWQFGEHALKANDEITTRAWPHPSFHPLNYSAERVHSYFIGAMKSRLGLSPFRGDRIVLDNGLTGPTSFEVKSPKPQQFDTRPAA